MTEQPVSELIVDYVRQLDPVVLSERDKLFLDREFLSLGEDLKISRAPKAPLLTFMSARWWVVNCDERLAPLSVFVEEENRRFFVGERCAFALDEGDHELRVWNEEYRIGLSVVRAAHPRHTELPGGDTTVPALPDSAVRVLKMFNQQARHKVVLAAYCRDYFIPGLLEPKPLARGEIMKCMGLETFTAVEKALDDVSKAIWGVTKGHRPEIAPYLIGQRLIMAKDQGLVPHRSCGHANRRNARG
jgi:hypothetical protein